MDGIADVKSTLRGAAFFAGGGAALTSSLPLLASLPFGLGPGFFFCGTIALHVVVGQWCRKVKESSRTYGSLGLTSTLGLMSRTSWSKSGRSSSESLSSVTTSTSFFFAGGGASSSSSSESSTIGSAFSRAPSSCGAGPALGPSASSTCSSLGSKVSRSKNLSAEMGARQLGEARGQLGAREGSWRERTWGTGAHPSSCGGLRRPGSRPELR